MTSHSKGQHNGCPTKQRIVEIENIMVLKDRKNRVNQKLLDVMVIRKRQISPAEKPRNTQMSRSMELIRAQYESGEAFDKSKTGEAIEILEKLDSSKMAGNLYYNLFVFYKTLGESEKALEALENCLKRDSNNSLAHFQHGMLKFSQHNYEEAKSSFTQSYDCLHGHEQIDYRPLNLELVLFESDITFNLALCSAHLGEFEDFKALVVSALETAQDIDRHAQIRLAEKDKTDEKSVLNYSLIKLADEIYRLSKKNKRLLGDMLNQPELTSLNDGLKTKVVGGDGKADFNPEPARRFTTDVAPSPGSFEVKSAKLTAMMARESKAGGSTGSNHKSEIIGRYSAPPRQPPPARKTLTNPIRNIVEESRIHQEPTFPKKEQKQHTEVAEPQPQRLAELKQASSHSNAPSVEVSEEKPNTAEISVEQSPTLSNYSEGVGEHKIQVNQRKDDKRLEIKVPNDSDGLNRSIRLAVKVNLDLEIEIDRNCTYETAMLHLRDQLHSIASLATPHSTTPRLYVKKTGEPVIDNENYKNLTDKVNSVDFVFK